MKKTLFIILITFFCIMIVLFVALRNAQGLERDTQKFNLEFEQYTNKNIYGTEIATMINKAVNNNEKYRIEKDENGFYIEDDSYSIKIDIYIKINETTYAMETIYKLGTEQFVQNFNSIKFHTTNVEYHNKTGRIAKIVLEQVEEE